MCAAAAAGLATTLEHGEGFMSASASLPGASLPHHGASADPSQLLYQKKESPQPKHQQIHGEGDCLTKPAAAVAADVIAACPSMVTLLALEPPPSGQRSEGSSDIVFQNENSIR
jgi:hypothetical protein